MLMTTTSVLEGRPVSRYLGVVTGEAIIGANVFRDLFAAVRDVVGGRSATYERALAEDNPDVSIEWDKGRHDSAVTYPILRAYGARGTTPAIVHLDAHGDLYDSFEGDRYSHACPFARVMEEGLARRLIQVGVRTLTAHQREQAAKFGVATYEPSRWR